MANDIIGAEECAELLHCTSDLVEELAHAGEVPALKIGRSWLFLRADLLVFLAEKARADAKERRAGRKPSRASPAQEIWSSGPQPEVGTPSRPSVSRTKVHGASDTTDRKDPIESPQRLLLPAADAARLLSMGKSTFWRAVKLGHLPKPIKFGGATRWNLAELRQFIAQHPIPPPPT